MMINRDLKESWKKGKRVGRLFWWWRKGASRKFKLVLNCCCCFLEYLNEIKPVRVQEENEWDGTIRAVTRGTERDVFWSRYPCQQRTYQTNSLYHDITKQGREVPPVVHHLWYTTKLNPAHHFLATFTSLTLFVIHTSKAFYFFFTASTALYLLVLPTFALPCTRPIHRASLTS